MWEGKKIYQNIFINVYDFILFERERERVVKIYIKQKYFFISQININFKASHMKSKYINILVVKI